MSHDDLWKNLEAHQGDLFHTVKGLPFRYEVRGGELFVDRRKKSITRATILKAYDRVLEAPDEITGPKKLNVFGAPYLWAIFGQLQLFLPARNGEDSSVAYEGQKHEALKESSGRQNDAEKERL